ncbi:MAG: VCBS repeat-containing protein [Proteobacteria bacterium]|nr:VCBS repeat-containing protein [Pseudomonadota bacterium]
MMRNAWLFVVVLSIFTIATITPGLGSQPKKVAVIPFSINSPQDLGFLQDGLFNMLFSRLSDPGKVDVMDREAIDKVMAKARESLGSKGSLTESNARIIGANMGVDYVLFGSLTHFGESVSLDASMVDMAGEKPTLTFFEQSNKMGDVIPMVNTFSGDINLKVFNRSIANELYAGPGPKGAPSQGALQYAEEGTDGSSGGFINLQQADQMGFQTHLKFDGQINALAIGDLNKDGKVQVVTATDDEILIYKLEGTRLLIDKKLEFSSTHRIISLDIADINKNGYPEIFVTSLNIHREGLKSFVLEYNGSTYTTLTEDESYYFRVIDGPDKSKILLGQKSANHPFKGKIYTMKATGSRYVTDKELRMPRSVSVLSIAKGPVTAKDAAEYVLTDENGRLIKATDTGTIDWKGDEQFGGTAHYFLLPRNDTDASFQERVYFNPRILFFDVNNDGTPEIFAVRNEELGGGVFGRYKRFTKGNLEILSWNGMALAPVAKTRSVQGWISDFAIADMDGDGKDELVVSAVGKSKILAGTKGQPASIISYKLE